MLEQKYGLDLPPKMRESFGYIVKNISDDSQKELMPDEIHDIFVKEYVNIKEPIQFVNYRFTQSDDFQTIVSIRMNDEVEELTGEGNGRLDAISNALQAKLGIHYTDLVYKEHAQEKGSGSNAVSYVGITANDDTIHWGCGVDVDIMTSSVKALFSAVNKLEIAAQNRGQTPSALTR